MPLCGCPVLEYCRAGESSARQSRKSNVRPYRRSRNFGYRSLHHREVISTTDAYSTSKVASTNSGTSSSDFNPAPNPENSQLNDFKALLKQNSLGNLRAIIRQVEILFSVRNFAYFGAGLIQLRLTCQMWLIVARQEELWRGLTLQLRQQDWIGTKHRSQPPPHSSTFSSHHHHRPQSAMLRPCPPNSG